MKDLHTITDIVKARNMFGKRHKVRVAVNKLDLVPVAWVGHTRLFDNAQRVQIEAELARIERKKASG